MPIEITCPSCTQSYTVDEGASGDVVPCNHCGEPVTIDDSESNAAYEATVDYRPDDSDAALTATLLTGTDHGKHWNSEPAASPGRQFGDYELIDEIARGGMGVVYRARQTRLNRVVALKMILSGQLASESDVQRFYTEAEAAAGLDHPGIVPIFEVGEHDGQHFFSMGFVEGSSLSERVSDGPLPVNEAARLTKLTAEAIAYAHQQGVIHRDLKPANILLDADSQPRVTDFGLAKKFNEDSGLTASGQILGTPGYMPPEQAGGDVDNVGPLADVYSLGAILYCLMTGRPPFQAASIVDTLMQVREQEPVGPRQLNPDIDVDLETICLKCLAKEPGRRYADAQALVDELERFEIGMPIQARPVGRVERAWRWCKRKPVLASLTAGITALVLFVAVAAPIVAVQQAGLREDADASAAEAKRLLGVASEKERIARDLAKRETAAKDSAEQASEELANEKERALATLYGTTISLAYREWQENNIARAKQLLTETPAKYRHWEWFYLNSLCNTERYNFTGHSGEIVATQFSHDSRYLATLAEDRTIRIWGIASGAAVATHDIGDAVVGLGPAGHRFASIDSQGIRVCDLVTGAVHARVDSPLGPNERAENIALSFDGSRVAVFVNPKSNGGRNDLRVIDIESGNVVTTITGLDLVNWIPPICFSRDGTKIACLGHQRTMAGIWDVETGERLQLLVGHIIPVSGLQFSPDGSTLATASLGGVIKLWNTSAGEERHSLHGHVDLTVGLDFSEDGRWLASSGKDRSVRIWDPHAGLEVVRIRGNTHYVLAVTLSPDGKWIASGCTDQTAKVWNIERLLQLEKGVPKDLQEHFFAQVQVENEQQREALTRGLHGMHYKHVSLQYRSIFGHAGPVMGVGFVDNGETFASSSYDEQVRFVRSADGSLTQSTPHENRTSDLAVSVDGNLTVAAIDARGPDTVKVWFSDTGQEKLSLEGPAPRTAQVAVSNDGRFIAAGGTGASLTGPVEVKVWDSQTGNLLHTLNGHLTEVYDLTFSPDAKTLLTTARNGMRLWNVNSGEELWTSDVPATSVAVHPDGSTFATAHSNGKVRFWDMSSGERAGEMEGPRTLLSSIAWTPDGKRIITGSDDSTVSVWDPATKLKLLTLRGHTHQITGLAVSQDGRRIASASYDGTVNIWDAGEESVAEDSSHWPVVLDSVAASTGDWHVNNGDWNTDDGRISGTLRPAELPNGIRFNGATAVLTNVDLPDEVELSCRVHCEAEATWQIGLIGKEGHAVIIELAGVENPMLLTKGAIQWVMNGPGKFSPPEINRQFEFNVGEIYDVRFVRRLDNVRVQVNGEDLFSTKLNLPPTPTLIIQCAYGAEGTVFHVEDFQARAPAASIRRGEARELLGQMFEEWLLPDDVRRELRKDESLSSDLRETALELLDSIPLPDADRLNAGAWETVINKEATDEEYSRAVQLARAATVQSLDEPTHLLTLGAALYQTGQFDEAVDTLLRARAGFVEQTAMTPPACLAFLCLSQSASGDSVAFKKSYRQLLDFSLSHAWNDDTLNGRLFDEIPSQPVADNDETQLRRLIVQSQQGGQATHDIDAWLAAWSDDARFTRGRGPEPAETDLTLQGEQLHRARPLQMAGEATLGQSIWPERIDVNIDGNRATARVTEITQASDSFDERECRYEFAKQDGDWKIVSQRVWKTRVKRGGSILKLNDDFYQQQDLAVERLRASGDRQRLITTLTNLAMHREAHKLLCEQIDQEGETFYLWRQRIGRAVAIGEVDDALDSVRQLIRMGPRNLSRREELMVMLAATGREDEAQAELAKVSALYRKLYLARAWCTEMQRLGRMDETAASEWITTQLDGVTTALSDADRAAFTGWIGGRQTWHIVGPLDGGEDFEGFDRATSLENHAGSESLPESPADDRSWSIVQPRPGGYVNLLKGVGRHEQVVAYSMAFVKVDAAQEATVLFGSDDSGKVWLNGEVVHSQRVHREFRTAADEFKMTLKPGVNTLLVKIGQATGDWGFGLDILDDRGVPLAVRWQQQQPEASARDLGPEYKR